MQAMAYRLNGVSMSVMNLHNVGLFSIFVLQGLFLSSFLKK